MARTSTSACVGLAAYSIERRVVFVGCSIEFGVHQLDHFVVG